jgi:hypothetical protein
VAYFQNSGKFCKKGAISKNTGNFEIIAEVRKYWEILKILGNVENIWEF